MEFSFDLPDSLSTELIGQAVLNAQSSLTAFALDEAFTTNIILAFGDLLNAETVESLRQQWIAGDFEGLPGIEIRSAAEINGANGAFSSDTNRIYLSSEYICQNIGNPRAVVNVLLEEIGHYFDWQINAFDAAGDEGANFSSLVQGQFLNEQQLLLLRGEDDLASVTLNGQVVGIEQAGIYTGNNIDTVINGMDQFLLNLQTVVNSEILNNTSLPLIGNRINNLSEIQQFINNFRDDIFNQLHAQLDSTATDEAEHVRTALFNALQPLGLLKDANNDGQVDLNDISVIETADDVTFGLKLHQNLSLLNTSTPIAYNTDLPGLGLDVQGNVNTKLGFDFNLDFGINKTNGFYVNTDAANELSVNLDASTQISNAQGKLGFLQLQVSDDPTKPTNFNATFAINLKDEADNQLTSSEFSLIDIDANLSGSADINLKTQTSFNGSTVLPSLHSDINVHWTSFGQAPTVAFNDVSWNLGSFFSNFARPVIEKVQKIAEPIKPIIDALTADLKLLKDIKADFLDFNNDGKITLLDIAEKSGFIDQDDRDFIESIAKINTLLGSIPTGSGDILINQGSFDLSGFNVLTAGSLSSVMPTLTTPTPTIQNADALNFINNVSSIPGLQFPLLTDPTAAFSLLLGKQDPLTLFEYNMPDLNFDFLYNQFFPIIGPLGAEIQGQIGATINLGFGFDTEGLGAFLKSSSSSNPFNGFYISDFDSTGADVSEVTLNASLAAFAALNGGVVSAGVGGGIFGNVNFNLNDANNDGKVRFDELSGLLNNPSCLFDTSGELTAGLRAYVKAGYAWFSYTKNFDSPRVTLLNFDLPANCSEGKGTPILATSINGELRLNTGPNSLGQLGVSPGGSSGGGGTPELGSQLTTQWTRQLGTPVIDPELTSASSFDVAVDSSGNVYITGRTDGSLGGANQGSGDAWVAKYDSSGNQVWVKQLGTSTFDQSHNVAVDSSGNVYITGRTEGSLGGAHQGSIDPWVAKYDSNGNQVWVKQSGTSDLDSSNGVALDSSGNVYSTGYTFGSLGGANQGSIDAWVAKNDSSGNQVWFKQLGTFTSDSSEGVAVDSSGNVYITGYTEGSLGRKRNLQSKDAWVAKYDSSGNQVWFKQLGTFASDVSNEAAVDSSGNVYITGYTEGSLGEANQGSGDAWVAKYDSSGNRLWIKQLGTSNFDYSNDVTLDNSGNVYITGYTEGSLGGVNQGSVDPWVAKYDSSGNQLWVKQLGTSNSDYSWGVAVDSSSNVYSTGSTGGSLGGPNVGGQDAWIAKFSQPATSQNLTTQAFSLQAAADSVSIDSTASSLTSTTEPGNTISKALDLGTITGIHTYSGSVGSDTDDFYRFSVNSPSNFGLLLNDLSANADLELLDSSGTNILDSSKLSGTQQESIDFSLQAGTYSVRVSPFQDTNTNYNLTLSVTNQDEFFTVKKKSPEISDNTLIVSRDKSPQNPDNPGAPVFTQEVSAGSKIIADGGEGNDTFELEPGIFTPAEIKGGSGDDLILSSSGNDLLDGGDGNDAIDGGAGADNLQGGKGDDLLEGGSGTDTIDGGEGSDTANYLSSVLGVSIDLSTGVVKGAISSSTDADGDILASIENLAGSNDVDILIGDTASNILNGWGGNDIIGGGNGDDLIIGGAGGDILEGGDGSDTVFYITSETGVSVNLATGAVSGGDAEGDIFQSIITLGVSDIENLGGSDFDDTLIGNSGNNRLVGGFGSDTLTGDAGTDSFVFNASTEGFDTITDFSVVDDTINVSAAGFGGGLTAGGAIAAEQFVIGSAASDAIHRFIYDNTSGALFFDLDGTGAAAQVQISTLSTDLAITSNNIFVI